MGIPSKFGYEQKIGSVRKVWRHLNPDVYKCDNDNSVVIIRPVEVVQVERHEYKYPNIRENPVWTHVEYLWDTAVEPHQREGKLYEEPVPPPEPKLIESEPAPEEVFVLPWYKRLINWLLKRRPIPQARLLKE